MADRGPLLRVEKVSKHFGGVKAVDEVSLEVNAGEVVGIIGDNGAGKSTLIKMISGVYVPDGGKIYFDGQETEGKSPREMREMGLETIYQDLALADNLDAGANIFLGREPVKSGFFNTVDRVRMMDEAKKTLKSLAFELPNLKRRTRDLSGGQRQGVAIARAMHWNAKFLVMDEPTAAVGVAGRRNIYKLVSDLREKGVPVIYVTPNVREAFAIVDRVVVIRRGRKVAERAVKQTSVDEIVGFIVGSKKEE
jgi:simple sugar transport system ATP-binding protein